MDDLLQQCLPEVMSFLKDIAVGYILYKVTKGPGAKLAPKESPAETVSNDAKQAA